MADKLDCGWWTGSSWAFSDDISNALHKLPQLSRRSREDKLQAKLKLLDPVSGWEWYLCEFDPVSKQAKGLVKGFSIESGKACMSSLGEKIQSRLMMIFDYEPELLSIVRQRLDEYRMGEEMSSTRNSFEYDVFVSYATEDEHLALKIVGGIQTKGIKKVCFAPVVLKVGDPLLASIEHGLRQSYAGIVIISKDYIRKQWTEYEFDTLIRQYIQKGKMILPIWHGVTEEQVYEFSTGLSGIFALNSESDLKHIVDNLAYSLSGAAPMRATVPSWEDPVFRFLQGRSELKDEQGRTFSLAEAALHISENRFPIWVDGLLLRRSEILSSVAEVLAYHPHRVFVSGNDLRELKRICIEEGFNPEGLLNLDD
jgi:hypothetical protein